MLFGRLVRAGNFMPGYQHRFGLYLNVRADYIVYCAFRDPSHFASIPIAQTVALDA